MLRRAIRSNAVGYRKIVSLCDANMTACPRNRGKEGVEQLGRVRTPLAI
jgi:hypothetical protein